MPVIISGVIAAITAICIRLFSRGSKRNKRKKIKVVEKINK